LTKLLEVKDLSVDYQTASGTLHAVRRVNLSVNEGEVLGVVGESGSGKTTVALAVAGLLPRNASVNDSSQILLEETNILTSKASDIDRIRGTGVFMIFQDPFMSLNPLMKIKHQMIEAIRVRCKRSLEPYNREEAEREALESLKKVRIGDADDIMERYPHQLSGGQNQRVMLAMALVEKPKLVIADEPTTALDVTTQAQILDLFKEIIRSTKMSMMFITHDLAVAATISDRLAVLYGGMLQESGPANEVLSNPMHPYTLGLIKSIPSKTKAEGMLEAIKGFFKWDGLEHMCAFAPRCPLAHDACFKGVPVATVVNGRAVRCVNYGEQYEN
jgi:peptide/nickel transport system ATP-binding protein